MSRQLQPLGPRRMKTLRLVVAGFRRGKPYSTRELRALLKLESSEGLYLHLRALRQRGLIMWRTGSARTLTPTEAGIITVASNDGTTPVKPHVVLFVHRCTLCEFTFVNGGHCPCVEAMSA